MLTDREILDAIPTNQFDEQTKMLWFGRFVERMMLDKLSKQQATDLNTNDRGEPDAIYLQLHDPDGIDVAAESDFTADGITWCWERIHYNDVRYVREDLSS